MRYANVQENWELHDTILVHSQFRSGENGWFNSLAALAGAPELSFFNVRNRNVGLMWNNQDTRDQFPYAMRLFSIGVSLWGPQSSTYFGGSQYDDQISHIWMNDLPRHMSLILKIQQDERLRTTVLFASPGYGPYGDGYGRGKPSAMEGVGNGVNIHHSMTTQGMPELKKRWEFPDNIEVPRRASLSVKLNINQYGKNLLETVAQASQNIPWPNPDNYDENIAVQQAFGIQVSLVGERLVQQRGQYHV